MCLWHMWYQMKLPPPTPREIRHFYTLRQSVRSGTYFLLSSKPDHWIPKGVKVVGKVDSTKEDKAKGFVWGFPSSNKYWKNSWFFIGGDWGQSIDFDVDGVRVTRKVPRYFCSPKSWNNAAPILSDGELKNLARAAVRASRKRGGPYLLDEEKMIKAGLFPRLSAARKRCNSYCPFFISFLTFYERFALVLDSVFFWFVQ